MATTTTISEVETPASLVSVGELAALIGVHQQTIYRLVRSGRLPFSRVGDRTLRFNVQEVLDALRRGHAGKPPSTMTMRPPTLDVRA